MSTATAETIEPKPLESSTEEAPPQQKKKGGWPKGKPRGPRKTAKSTVDLHGQLKDGAMAVSVGIMFATGSIAAASDPRVTEALESRADKMAGAWVAVAQENARVAQALDQLMSGGVWLGAIGNTLSFGVLLMTFTGRAPLPGHLAQTLIPELRQFDFGPPPEADSPTPEDNGAQGA